jgi:hypothetical protein
MAEGFPNTTFEGEVFDQMDAEMAAELSGIVEKYGVDYFQENFGLGLEEISHVAGSGNRRGTIAKMLTDEECPVGEWTREEYEANGIEGVQTFFNDELGKRDKTFRITVSESTLAREGLKKKINRRN